MAKHFHNELEKIKKKILSLGAMVEERVRMATRSIESRDAELAKQVIQSDYQIDEMEIDVEEECLKVIALHQPVASDLRFLICIIKINNDLERIGDLATNIAHRVMVISKVENPSFTYDYNQMADKTNAMLQQSLDALVNLDQGLAKKVCELDDDVDSIKADVYAQCQTAIKNDPDNIEYLLNVLLISRHMERIADHTTNIAEEVIYMIEGEIVRHGKFW